MKKIQKKMDVEITSDRELVNGQTMLGNGTLVKDGRKFRFEVCPPQKRSSNPLLYSGKFFRVRQDAAGRYRFNAAVMKDDIKGLTGSEGIATIAEEIHCAINEITKNLE